MLNHPVLNVPVHPSASLPPPPGLEGWLPAGVVVVCREITMPTEQESTAEERSYIQTAVAKRQREFLSGRLAARQALARLGVPTSEIPVAKSRNPVWPKEIVGSIAHSGLHCVAAVAKRADFLELGLDVEPAVPLEAKLWPRICGSLEMDWLMRRPERERGLWARHFFCAKEAVYKGQFPSTETFLEFHDLEVSLDPERTRFQVRLAPHARPPGLTAEARLHLEQRFARAWGSWRPAASSIFFAYACGS